MGGGIDREEQAVRFEGGVEVAEHHAGLHPGTLGGGIDGAELAQMFGAVYHHTGIDGLAALAGAAATGEDGDSSLAADGHGCDDILHPFGDDDGGWHNLVDGGIGGIAAAVGGAEQHFAGNFPPQPCRQGAGSQISLCVHGGSPLRIAG